MEVSLSLGKVKYFFVGSGGITIGAGLFGLDCSRVFDPRILELSLRLRSSLIFYFAIFPDSPKVLVDGSVTKDGLV